MAGEDRRGVKTFWVLILRDPCALGRVIGYVEGFDEDLILLEGGERVGVEGKGLVRTGEGSRLRGWVSEYPLAGFCWAGHVIVSSSR